jgi:hypothetical protein
MGNERKTVAGGNLFIDSGGVDIGLCRHLVENVLPALHFTQSNASVSPSTFPISLLLFLHLHYMLDLLHSPITLNPWPVLAPS